MIRLSICTISKNESTDLPGFLENVLKIADEVIIVDDGSTDRTKEIALSFGNKVRFYQHDMGSNLDFAGQRNKCIQYATNDWILHMDVDERLTPELAQEIGNSITVPKFNGYRYRRLNYFLHNPMKGGGFQSWNKSQFAKKGKHYFVNKIHENCLVEGEVGQLNSFMWHLNDTDYLERMRKSFVYTQMEAEKLLKSGIKIEWYHILFRPLMKAFKRYFFQGGFRDGVPGLVFALHCFTAIFKVNTITWNKQNNISRSDIEYELKLKWEEYRENES